MAYSSAHENIDWQNGSIDHSTPLGKSNLSKINRELRTHDERIIELDVTRLQSEDINSVIVGISLDEDTGIFTFTRWDNSTFTLDTLLEKVITNFDWDVETQTLTLILKDGSTKPVDLSALIKENEFDDSDTVAFELSGHNVKAHIVKGSITDEYLESNYKADCQVARLGAEKARDEALAAKVESQVEALRSEGWAVGEQNGVPVGTDSPFYHNNAKYYSDRASGKKLETLDDVQIIDPEDNAALVWDASIQKWVNGDVSITVDETLSTESENPVQNKVITRMLFDLMDALVEGRALSVLRDSSGDAIVDHEGNFITAASSINLGG